MRRTAIGMLVAVVFLGVIVWAQAGPAGSSVSFLMGASCQAPTKGAVILCGQADGQLTVSKDGAPYAALAPAQANLSSFTCSSLTASQITLNGTGATLTSPAGSGCIFK